ncbi:hypothetical protein BDN71DRAFT_1503252 [Pleurotus eryngii]|uniref:Uncharacterized protein n=1 Tax=Pleurotus eryngii TaxID=5323 RepID=A0A9P6DC11_PLEER|nr:hypothetical protein BDN71DRAFT_1503252 [Pleurotus eryngii]
MVLGCILPLSTGTQQSTTGTHQVLPIPIGEAVHDVLVLGRPGWGNVELDTFYAAQCDNFARLTFKESQALDFPIVTLGHFPYLGSAEKTFHVRFPCKYQSLEGAPILFDFLSGKVRALYPVFTMQDYRQGNFEVHEQPVVQQAIYNSMDELVKPWEQCDVLKPGTLVAANVTINVECMNEALVM